jgi:hypothetical protein
MKLRLRSSTRTAYSATGYREQFIFSVLDLDRSKSYPQNFVCLLPKELKSTGNNGKSRFFEIFGEDSNQIAVELLRKAYRSEDDVELKKEIEKRLKLLEPKKPVTDRCAVCGCVFEPRRYGRSLERVCKNCSKKNVIN